MQTKYDKIFFITGIMLLCYITYIITKDTFQLTLIWNTFLATIPLFMLCLEKHIKHTLFKLCILIIWIIFLPNAFYTFTDLIHIQPLNFFKGNSYAPLNLYHIHQWLQLISITSVSMLGFWLGCVNVTIFIKRFHHISLQFIIIFMISFLSSIGIYIGRFLRLNSWDIVHPFNLFKSFIYHMNTFTIQFIGLMTVFIFISCLLYFRTNRSIQH